MKGGREGDSEREREREERGEGEIAILIVVVRVLRPRLHSALLHLFRITENIFDSIGW